MKVCLSFHVHNEISRIKCLAVRSTAIREKKERFMEDFLLHATFRELKELALKKCSVFLFI